jgi:hypothetical protein
MRNETIKFKNPTDRTIKLESIGLEDVEAGAEIEIPIELAAPGRSDSGNRTKSAIECVAPQLQPVDPIDLKAWMATPGAPEPKSKIVTIAARQGSEAPGVKALREQRQKAQDKAQAVTPVAPTK